MRLIFPAITAALLALPLAAVAKPVLYECDITKMSEKSNWIAEKIMFVAGDDGSVRVVDRHLLHFMGGPAVARVRKGANKLTMSWLMTGLKSTVGRNMAPASYKAVLNTKARKVTVYVTSSAYSGARMRGTGGCKVRTDGRLPKAFR